MSVESENKKSAIKLNKKFTLKDDFPVPAIEDWRTIVEPFLKGVPFEKKLCTRTYEEITLEPLYFRSHRDSLPLDLYPGSDNRVRGNSPEGYIGKEWDIAREIPAPLAEDFNTALLNDLNRGQNAVNLVPDTATLLAQDAHIADTGSVGDRGTSLSALPCIEKALKGIDLTAVGFYVDAGFSALPLLTLLNAYFIQQKIDPSKLCGAIDQDPLAYLARTGNLPFSLRDITGEIKEVLTWLNKHAPGLKGLGVSMVPCHEGGANAVQELAWTLSTIVEYMNRLIDAGMNPEDVAGHLHITFGIGPFFFMEIAKIRAARLMIGNVLKEYGLKGNGLNVTIHGRTAGHNQTLYDPYVNILRTTTEAFSAILGGVDSLHTNTFDERAVDYPSSFSRRVARNIQIILKDECHLDRLIDPAGGSYFVETLTHQLAGEGWTLFRETESRGGMSHALMSGWIQDRIKSTRLAREKDFRKRKRVIIGLNMYADLKQIKVKESRTDQGNIKKIRTDQLNRFRQSVQQDENKRTLRLLDLRNSDKRIEAGTNAVLAGATLGDISQNVRSSAGEGVSVDPVPPFRASEIFERFRDRGFMAERETGERPKVILVHMGPPGQHKIRSDFSRGFLEPGGFDVISTQPMNSPEEAAEEVMKSKAFAAVLCSTDETYAEIVPAFIKALQTNQMVIVAGRPAESMDLLKDAGVDAFLYLGADTADFYEALWKRAGGSSHA